jgi:trans-aconitate 2-methyltransferase
MQWDPVQYSVYGSERGRPFFDLINQVAAADPQRIVDLGCGPGELTATLARRWPQASVLGLDSSPEMIARASSHVAESLAFSLATADSFSASGVDVLVSNAVLQWVPNHRRLLSQWAAELNPGGWLAFQVPANFSAASHQLMRQLAGSPRWREQLGEVLRQHEHAIEPADYLDQLTSTGLRVNVWQTTYLHVLPGADPVLEWVRGTGLRPVLDVLAAAESTAFEAEYAALLREAYPSKSYGTVYPFLRTFVVAEKPA